MSGIPPQPGQRLHVPRKVIAQDSQPALKLESSASSVSDEVDCLFVPSVPSAAVEAPEVPPEGLSLFLVPC